MKTISFLIIFAIISAFYSIVAQERVAVLPVSGNANEGIRGMLTDAISDGITNSGQYKLVERGELDKVMDELRLQNDDSFDETNVSKVGKQLGAKYVCLASCHQNGYNFMISYRLVSVETGEILFKNRKTTTESSLMEIVSNIGNEKLFVQSQSETTAIACDLEIMKADLKELGNAVSQGWRLPTIAELRCMCEQKKEIGGFNYGEYLSSEQKNGFRQGVKFSSCTQTSLIDNSYSVRWVRKR